MLRAQSKDEEDLGSAQDMILSRTIAKAPRHEIDRRRENLAGPLCFDLTLIAAMGRLAPLALAESSSVDPTRYSVSDPP